jgi:cytoskeleton protein RodZ
MLLSTAHSQRQVDPAEALMREIGEQLRQVRLERGEELAQVAEYLRIKPAYLHALEQGDMAALPGRPYALGFLRTYVDYLGFNGNELVARIRNVVGTLTDRSRLHIRTPMPESRMPKAPVMLLSLVLVAGVYGVWIYLHSDESAVVEPVSAVPDELGQTILDGLPPSSFQSLAETAAPQDVGAAGGAHPPAPPSDGDRATMEEAGIGDGTGSPAEAPEAEERVVVHEEPVAASAPTPASQSENGVAATRAGARGADVASGGPLNEAEDSRQGVDTAEVRPDPVAAPDTPGMGGSVDAADAAPNAAEVLASLDARFARATAGAPRVHGVANTDARVILRARSTSWIEVSSANGDYAEAATLLPGQVFLVPDRLDLTLWTGNAGGLEVIVDGERVPPLGGEGVVMRRVSLDRASLLARSETADGVGR